MVNETTIMIHHVLFLLVLIYAVGVLSGKIAKAVKLPDVAVFLISGMVLGQGLHLINEPSTSFTNQFILIIGSALILFDGGRNIRLQGLAKVWVTVSLLSVPGVLITCGAVAAAVHYLLGLDWIYAFLLGAIISSTDPATLIPVFKQVKIRPKVRETVESESAFNDATGSILTFSILAIIMGTQKVTISSGIMNFLTTALGGIAVGLFIGFLLTYLTSHRTLGLLRDYTTIAMIVAALGAFLLGETFHVSGFMATFVAGLIWGNAPLFKLNMKEKESEMNHFSENLTLMMRMLIFILLGSQVNIEAILHYFWPSVAVIAIFMLIARPLTVLACALLDRSAKWERNEILFMFWVRETGVIPAALAGMVAAAGIEHVEIIAAVTFMAVLLTIVFQASTTAFVARKLGIVYESDR
ncbi:sodium:proton antiporter [Paenibacillus sp. LHD-38]|uniref:cation:proton antiporter n=1 Tax=Paenibacillus sp. LHD-38 TaxID=3072143 RepID=UPI00280DA702|nr:sodium:proton antiporter [Paenibacillus sp. LHD-38]MDQ8735842.1 sodium:proton antiporter [Paenibacillus sp. LHD-38]